MRLVSTSILLFLYSYIYSQQVVIRPPIFSSFECTEFFRLYTGDIMNFSDVTYEGLMYLEVNYTSPNGRTSRLADGVLQGNPSLSISPGTTPINDGTYEFVYPNRFINFYDRNIASLLSRTKCLPPGTYDVCLTLYENGTTDFNDNYIAQTCYQREKVMPNQLFLVSPFEGDEVSVDLPLFTWTAIMPFNPDAMYRIQIVEVLANQTPFEAFRSNPIFYQESGLRSNIFQYPVSARPMLPCTNYAWRATYELDSRFINTGFVKAPNVFQESEIWEFSRPCNKEEEEDIFDELEPKYFYKLTSGRTQSYHIHKGKEFSIEIDNSYQRFSKVSYTIIDLTGRRFDPPPDFDDAFRTEKSINPTNVKSGKNHFTLDLDELGLTKGNFYTLKVKGPKEDLFVKFKYEDDEK